MLVQKQKAAKAQQAQAQAQEREKRKQARNAAEQEGEDAAAEPNAAFSQIVCQVPQAGQPGPTTKQQQRAAPKPPAPSGDSEWLIGPQRKSDFGRKTLVLDLDETLVHSQFKPVENADIVLPVEIEG